MQTSCKLLNSARGAYTFMETVVSVAIVGILFVALYGGMTTGFSVIQTSREDLRATQVMLQYVEGIRLYNWNQLAYSNWIPSTFTNYYYPNAGAGESLGIAYYGSILLNTNPTLHPAASYSSNMCAIKVTVNWTNGTLTHTRSMSTYAARDGMQNYVYNSTGN